MANRVYTLQDKINQLLQYKTQKEAAAILGISDRTVRRWKTGTTKHPVKVASVKTLTHRATYYRSVSRKHGAPKSLPVAPPVVEVPVQGAPLSTHADVKKLDTDSIINYVGAVTGQDKWVRFLIAVPKSPSYPKGVMTTHWFNFKGAPPGVMQREINKLGNIKKVIATTPK